MNKKEILAKSRQESKDEGIEYAHNKGHRIGMIVVLAMFLVLVIYNLIKDLNNNAIFALLSMYFGVENYGMYRFTNKKGELVCSVLGVFSGLVFFISYIIGTSR